jgi:hypothetical protein
MRTKPNESGIIYIVLEMKTQKNLLKKEAKNRHKCKHRSMEKLDLRAKR